MVECQLLTEVINRKTNDFAYNLGQPEQTLRELRLLRFSVLTTYPQTGKRGHLIMLKEQSIKPTKTMKTKEKNFEATIP